MATIYSSFEKQGNKELRPRTDSYRFTVDSLDDPMLHDLKAMIKINNKHSRAYHRKLNMEMNVKYTNPLETVRIRARGPRFGSRAWEQSLPAFLETNTHWDVYVHCDTTGIRVFNNEIRTGQTAAQQKEIYDLECRIMRLKQQADDNRKDYYKLTFKNDQVKLIAANSSKEALSIADECYKYLGPAIDIRNCGKNPVNA